MSITLDPALTQYPRDTHAWKTHHRVPCHEMPVQRVSRGQKVNNYSLRMYIKPASKTEANVRVNDRDGVSLRSLG